MGLLDLPATLLFSANRLILGVLPVWAAPIIWGLFAGGVSMAIYSAVSPRKRLAEAAMQARLARSELIEYDGDFAGMLQLARNSIALSLRRIRLGLLPTVAAAVPVVPALAWLPRDFPDVGIPWLSAWEVVFFASVALASLVFRTAFRVR